MWLELGCQLFLDFLYKGEANVFQDNLDSFLALAEELKLKGEKALDDLKKDVSEQNEEGKQAFSSKVDEIKAKLFKSLFERL